MNIQRMKFAWARGARFIWPGFEKPFASPPVNFDDTIYPLDEHLQYGQLSTALREDAIYSDSWAGDISLLNLRYLEAAESLMKEELGIDYTMTNTEDCMALLFFAEYLADMGL